MNGWIWFLVFLIVAIIIFMIVWKATKLNTKVTGPVTRDEFTIIANRVNLLWALLIFWILINIFYFIFFLFISQSVSEKVAQVTK